jgi:hypothetical protein
LNNKKGLIMKKIVLLLLLPLTILMADLVLTKDHKLQSKKQDTTTPTTPTPVSGVIPVTAARVWYDTYDASDVVEKPSYVNADYGQFDAFAHHNAFPNYPTVNIINAWYVIYEKGDGTSCSFSVNTATPNTVVEIGRIRAWVWYGGNNWVQFDDSAGIEGMRWPSTSDPYSTDVAYGLGCPDSGSLRTSHLDIQTIAGVNAEGRPLGKPAYGFTWHGWGDVQHHIDGTAKAIFVQQYFRKVVQNAALPDDRATTHYVAQVGSDSKLPSGGTFGAEPGVSGTREIGTDWTPVTFLSQGITQAEFMANPPPFATVP